jgi:hypothetical protein
VAEEPGPATRLLDAGDYAGFAAYVAHRGWALGDEDMIAREAQRLHAALSSVRHPPGPTPAFLTIMRLVDGGHLDAAALDAS